MEQVTSRISHPTDTLRSPKRGSESRLGRSGWYDYYAGFSPNFVSDALALSAAKTKPATLLDPWNGSGTTSEIGVLAGFDTFAFDLSPAMVIVAKARMLGFDVHPSLASLTEEILLRAETVDQDFPNDPLGVWLSAESVPLVRSIELALQSILVDAKNYCPVGTRASLDGVSPLAAFFYVALFRSLRKILRPFRSSNPTWIKDPATVAEQIYLQKTEFVRLLRAQVAQMIEGMSRDYTRLPLERVPAVRIDVASSLSLPLDDCSIDVVVTSPPYCTRIDYVVKTGPELALLGIGQGSGVRVLREGMIGTPTIARHVSSSSPSWGRTCLNLLDKVSEHKSRASKSYYLKTQTQYFDGLHKSIVEINRVLADSGECFFVVQDSYYKEIWVDLAQIVHEMGDSVGWTCDLRRDFPSSRNIVGLNRGAKVYKQPTVAVESILHFTKA